jgi:hypothetical protein
MWRTPRAVYTTFRGPGGEAAASSFPVYCLVVALEPGATEPGYHNASIWLYRIVVAARGSRYIAE